MFKKINFSNITYETTTDKKFKSNTPCTIAPWKSIGCVKSDKVLSIFLDSGSKTSMYRCVVPHNYQPFPSNDGLCIILLLGTCDFLYLIAYTNIQFHLLNQSVVINVNEHSAWIVDINVLYYYYFDQTSLTYVVFSSIMMIIFSADCGMRLLFIALHISSPKLSLNQFLASWYYSRDWVHWWWIHWIICN